MQKSFLIWIGVLSSYCALAQQPVHWRFSIKRLNETTCELHMTAGIEAAWHIYAQKQPDDAIALPTKIEINQNPLLRPVGKIVEIGNLEKHKVESLGIEQYQYSQNVDFVQLIELKAKVKTSVSGKITFQVCTDEQCLPPTELPFSVSM